MWTTLPAVDWDGLFGDLEAEFAGQRDAELAGEVADRTRREVAQLALRQRFAAAPGVLLRISLLGGETVAGRLDRSGVDWAVLVDPVGARILVSLPAVATVAGLPLAAQPDPESGTAAALIAARTTFGYVLRAVARDRSTATLLLVTGARLTGTVDRVGADFLDLAEHDLGEARRADAVTGRRSVALATVAAVLVR